MLTSSTAGGAAPRSGRVVVTGVGAVSSIGADTAHFLAGLRAGREGAKPISRFDTAGFERVSGCQIDGFDPAPWLKRLSPAEAGRATQFAAVAARMALEDAKLDDAGLRARRALISIGTTDGEAGDWDTLVEEVTRQGFDRADLSAAAKVPAGRLSALVARELGCQDAEAVTLATACAAGNYAIGYGFDAVASGDVDIALCGGAEAMGRLAFAGFTRLGAIASLHCQPFDRDREGILTGEGGAVLVLESLESALARGARILAEVLGYGMNCDASHPVAPDRDSVAECVRLALADAGVAPEEVGFVSAHGTATRANDAAEAGAVRDVFGEGTAPRTVGLKSMLGHSMGAASALAAVACVLSIVEGFIPPTINHVHTDPECAIDCVPNVALQERPVVVQNNALAFGGNNTVVLFGAYGLPAPRTDGRTARSAGSARPNPVITAWTALSPLGLGAEDFAAGVRTGRRAVTALDDGPADGPDISFAGRPQAVPCTRAGLVPGFDVRQELGRKGVRSLDRRTAFAATAVKRLLEAPGGGSIAGVGPQTGVVFGTSTAPAQSLFEFGRDTWVNDKPYHVDAGQFTTMVMNAAASQCAIRHTLKGPNATVAAGRAAGLAALQYAVRLHRSGRAESLVCGSAVEFTAARAWLSRAEQERTGHRRDLGEGAALWLLESADGARAAGRPVLAEVAGVEFGVAASPDEAASVLEDRIRRVLTQAGVAAEQVWAVLDSGVPGEPGGTGVSGTVEFGAATAVLGDGPRRISCADFIGDTEHASVAFQIATALAYAGSAEAAGRYALIVCADLDGLVGCALLKL